MIMLKNNPKGKPININIEREIWLFFRNKNTSNNEG